MRSKELSLEKYDSDKINSRYLEQYDPIFEPFVQKKIALLELGVLKGGSLSLWRDYFPSGTIAGVDIKLPEGYIAGDRISMFKGSQADPQFLSHVEKIIATEVIVSCDMLVSAITLTHFSRPIIEAWALKKPVVCSNGLHASELVDDNVNGLLFKVNDHQQLAEKIKYAITNKEITTKLGEEGYQKAVNVFGNNDNLENIVRIGKDLAY